MVGARRRIQIAASCVGLARSNSRIPTIVNVERFSHSLLVVEESVMSFPVQDFSKEVARSDFNAFNAGLTLADSRLGATQLEINYLECTGML